MIDPLDYFDDRNRVIDSAKCIYYTTQYLYGEWSYEDQGVIVTINKIKQITRHCTKNYAYVGMSKQTALQCYNAMTNKYTRSTKFSKWDSTIGDFVDSNGGNILMGDIRLSNDGNLYRVDISLNEVDTKLSYRRIISWSNENNRDYDED